MTPDIPAPSRTSAAGAAARRSPRPGTGAALALLAAVVVTAAACLLAVSATPTPQRAAVAWGGSAAAVLLCAAVTLAAYHRLEARRLRGEIADRDGELAARDAAAAARETAYERFATETVPFVVERLRQGASAETALASAPPTETRAQRDVLTTLAREVHRGEGLRASAMSACANAAGRVQALSTSMAADLRDMEHRHADEEVLGDLLHLDHRVAQAGRLADSIAVLTGARSGRRWAKPIVMESILRGALGRISGYQRVRLHSTSTAAVAGHAAEGVMHVLAEIMDNAANFSPPTSEVHVYVEEVTAGVVVTVEDGGLVMGEVALRRAQQAVSGEAFDLSALSGSRLGLAVVGRLSRKHGLNVSFRPSAHGGTGVVVMLPQELITEARAGAPAREATAAQPSAPATSARPAASEPAPTPQSTTPAPVESAPVQSAPAAPASPAPAQEPAVEQTMQLRPEDIAQHVPEQHSERSGERTGEHASTADTAPVGRGAGHPAERTAERPAERTGETRLPDVPETPPAAEVGESGLPKRRRGQTLAAAQQQRERARAAEKSADRGASRPSGARFGAFRQAVQGAQEARDGEGRTDTSDTGRDTGSPSPTTASSRAEDDTE
ncbi:ATP-binding protein [Streptomyces sp. ODS28]|uniref:ATP-binding protein n=1 Tax=Streptomyces sp. ODS28 TaxID=3136688 RepID=UPI0031EDC328